MKALSISFLLLLGYISCNKKVYSLTLKDYRTIEGIKIGMPIQEAIKVLDKKFVVEKKKIIVLDDEPKAVEYLVTSNKKVPLFTFNEKISYSQAFLTGQKQKKIMDQVMKKAGIADQWHQLNFLEIVDQLN